MSFHEKVMALLLQIPRGRVSCYGMLAAALGNPHACRAVAQILSRNVFAPVLPCYRVVFKSGQLGGYHGVLNSPEKVKLLRSEGVTVKDFHINAELWNGFHRPTAKELNEVRKIMQVKN